MASKKNPQVDWYFTRGEEFERWGSSLKALRTILLGLPALTEELKWGHPCYTVGGKNVVLIHAFKDYCALFFHKGALFKDAKKLLVQQTANVQAGRQLRFKSLKEITALKALIKAYALEAVSLEESGAKVAMKKAEDYKLPEELLRKFRAMPRLKEAFMALTPGRQRAYILFIAGAKQEATREARVEKHVDRILDGLGLDD
ncbi:MAG TPA: DUF1801 domain-containing protein [Fibrobacteria bacterium]|jgi:uncharacterized protein YdeI (YjbR/CyaY-like superfamily)|nr:DUF1801 domain-containing protein [Fibrobacteria bacterium]